LGGCVGTLIAMASGHHDSTGGAGSHRHFIDSPYASAGTPGDASAVGLPLPVAPAMNPFALPTSGGLAGGLPHSSIVATGLEDDPFFSLAWTTQQPNSSAGAPLGAPLQLPSPPPRSRPHDLLLEPSGVYQGGDAIMSTYKEAAATSSVAVDPTVAGAVAAATAVLAEAAAAMSTPAGRASGESDYDATTDTGGDGLGTALASSTSSDPPSAVGGRSSAAWPVGGPAPAIAKARGGGVNRSGGGGGGGGGGSGGGVQTSHVVSKRVTTPRRRRGDGASEADSPLTTALADALRVFPPDTSAADTRAAAREIILTMRRGGSGGGGAHGGRASDAAANGRAAAAAAAAADRLLPAEEETLKKVLNRRSAERSRLGRRSAAEAAAVADAEKDVIIEGLREQVVELTGEATRLRDALAAVHVQVGMGLGDASPAA